MRVLILLLIISSSASFSQKNFPHQNAHAHNDYEHERPLKDALSFQFISVEADIHLVRGQLLVAHSLVSKRAPSLEQLYFNPLDSILKKNNGNIYPGFNGPFFLMIDIKTEGSPTYAALHELLMRHPALICKTNSCPVKIFLSGNRPVELMIKEGYRGIALDGRPEDLGKGYSKELVPVISDNYNKWSRWNGKAQPENDDLLRIKKLASEVHAEGKKLRLWAIPDNEIAWQALLDAGVDLINTDHLKELDEFLSGEGK
jgi:hypothetical protein